MKTLILLLMPFFALSQTTKVDYFRTSVQLGEVVLYWSTFAEDGADVFTVYASHDSQKWENLGDVKSCEVATGCIYVFNAGAKMGVWYYRLNWKEGVHYATSTTNEPHKTSALKGYNILGQKIY